MADSRDEHSYPNASPRGKGTAVVTEARRLLMRFATQLHSHALDLTRLKPYASSASSLVDLTDLARHGPRESESSPEIPQAHTAALPGVSQAGDESQGGVLAFHVLVSGDSSRFMKDFSVFVRESPMTVAVPPLAHPVIEPGTVFSFPVDVRLSGGEIHNETMIASPEKTVVTRLPVTPPTFLRSGKAMPRSVPVRFSVPNIRPVPNRITAEVALERRSTSLPSIETATGRNAHLLTRQLLARVAGAGVGADEIEIVGIYRRVPISAAAMLSIDDRTNALCVYLRADAARVVQSQGRQIVSLVFGRVRSDGRLVRALVQTPNPPTR